jgi:hypothetical protein
MELGHDEWCCVATHVINKIMFRRRIRVSVMYATLCILCKHPEYRRHLRSEMKRLYMAIHVSWHRSLDDLVDKGIGTWYIDAAQPFIFYGNSRCSVLFKNKTTSCLIGFLVLRGSDITFFPVHTLYGYVVFPPIETTDAICPVFRK